jgi:hypothetical protein
LRESPPRRLKAAATHPSQSIVGRASCPSKDNIDRGLKAPATFILAAKSIKYREVGDCFAYGMNHTVHTFGSQ